MRQVRIGCLFAAAVLGWPAMVQAQTSAPVSASDDPILAALVAEAMSASAEVQAAKEALAAARARPAQVRSLPDPVVSVVYTNDAWRPTLGQRDMTTLGVAWSQDLPWPGKRGLRAAVLEREAEMTGQRAERVRRSVAAALRRSYYGLVLARQRLALLRDQAELWRQMEGMARARYGVGQGAQQDVLRTQVEITRTGQREAELGAEMAVRLAELNRLLGRKAEEPLETPVSLALESLDEPFAAVFERLCTQSPELLAAQMAVDQSETAVELARREGKPDLNLQASYMNRGSLDAMWQVGIGVHAPLWRGRRRAARAEAEARLSEAESRREAVAFQLRLRTQERLAALEASQRIARLYREGIVPQDRLSVESAIAGYQAGRLPFVTVLEALGALYADRSGELATLAAHARTRASLEEASLEASSEADGMSEVSFRASLPPASGPAGMNGGGPAMGMGPR